MMVEQAKIYINGRLIGFHPNAMKLTQDLIQRRRDGKLDPQINIAFHEDTNEIYVNTDAGRVQRPLIVVENGKPKLTNEMVKAVKEGKLVWKELIENGVVEYLDAEEEENTLIALREEDITKEHTHLEIDPIGIFSVITSLIPYLEHDLAGKVLHGAKMFKQAQGISGINYNLRSDTESYILYYPEKELVKTRTMDLLEMEKRPQVQSFVVAIMPYHGFKILDAVVLNKGAVDRGLGRSAYFRTYETSENRYPLVHS